MKIMSRPATAEFNENYNGAMYGIRPRDNRCDGEKTFNTYCQSKAKYRCLLAPEHEGDCKFDVDLHLVPLSELQ